jgi:hypothetical protein
MIPKQRQRGIRNICRAATFGLLLAFSQNQEVLAQANVDDAIRVIVTFCVAGGEKFEVSGSGGGSLELKREGGANTAGITLSSRTEAKGLVDGINNAMTSVTASQASEARKCMQPYINLVLEYLAKIPSGSFSLPSTSGWNHNNSIMSIRSAGDRVTIFYDQPRQGMIDEGVRRGTVVFDGKRTGNRLSGTSYVFDRNCSPIPYPDDGVVSSEQEIVLSGRRVPTQLASCQPVAYRVDPSIFYRRD